MLYLTLIYALLRVLRTFAGERLNPPVIPPFYAPRDKGVRREEELRYSYANLRYFTRSAQF